MAWQDRFMCWFGRHDGLMERTAQEIYLRCERCGRRTAGWQLDRPAPAVRKTERRRRENVLPMRRRG
jgi:hypothetical protein